MRSAYMCDRSQRPGTSLLVQERRGSSFPSAGIWMQQQIQHSCGRMHVDARGMLEW
jgi:hypothetical protein